MIVHFSDTKQLGRECLTEQEVAHIPQFPGMPSCSAFSICSLLPQKLKLSIQLSRSNRRGAAVVEFAFVAPLLFFLILGMIEFSRVMMVQQILTNAARVGVREAVLDATVGSTGVIATVDNYLKEAGVDKDDPEIPAEYTVTVDPTPSSSMNAGEPVTVEIELRYGSVSMVGDAGLDLLSGQIFGMNYGTIGGLKNRMLTATVVMAREADSD